MLRKLSSLFCIAALSFAFVGCDVDTTDDVVPATTPVTDVDAHTEVVDDADETVVVEDETATTDATDAVVEPVVVDEQN